MRKLKSVRSSSSMKMGKTVLLFAILAIYSVDAFTNYCGKPDLCYDNPDVHITCKSTGVSL